MPSDSPPRRAVIVPYEPSWASRGVALTEELARELGPLALRVEHIGSTAIPGMAAKAVFDLQIGVSDLDEAAGAFDGPLTRLGFDRWPVADYDTYTDLKDPVVDLVVVIAEEWASETGWTS
jgi:GrpB-like predicted nucleotidyltransferase (UPF0157 family)